MLAATLLTVLQNVEAETALRAFREPEGFCVELVAAEPLRDLVEVLARQTQDVREGR